MASKKKAVPQEQQRAIASTMFLDPAKTAGQALDLACLHRLFEEAGDECDSKQGFVSVDGDNVHVWYFDQQEFDMPINTMRIVKKDDRTIFMCCGPDNQHLQVFVMDFLHEDQAEAIWRPLTAAYSQQRKSFRFNPFAH